MVHIAIEGMDGVGKTTACRMLSEKTGYTFVEKPLHYLLEEAELADDSFPFESYRKLAGTVNKNPDRNFTAWFYALGHLYLYEKFRAQNIITDRHIVSNYCWSGTENNADVYDLVLNKIGKPFLTVILYARPEVIESRLKKRNPNDKNLSLVEKSEEAYERMKSFCRQKDFPHVVIDTSEKNAEQVTEEILNALKAVKE